VPSAVEIEIKSGFVAARSNGPDGWGIGINPGSDSGSYVRIAGGSVYASNTVTAANIMSPAPQNGAGTSPVFPLYVSADLAGNKNLSVFGPVYMAKTIGKSAARFLVTGLWTEAGADQFPAAAVENTAGLFPFILSAMLWLPANSNYSGITVNGMGNYRANVQPSIMPYTQDMSTNTLTE
jgi:hypothetical protein